MADHHFERLRDGYYRQLPGPASDGGPVLHPDVYGLDRAMAALVPQLRGQPVGAQKVALDSAAAADSAAPARHPGR